MNLDKHYEESTQFIRVGGEIPFANSLPIEIVFLDNKKAKKVLRKCTPSSISYMNICFERIQDFNSEDVLDWTLDNIDMKVTVLSSTQLFVKGRKIWAYCCAINED